MVRDGWVLGAAVLIYVFLFLRTVSAQAPGKYYTGAGGTSSTCISATCPPCNYYQYNLGCTGASSGTCTNCTNAAIGNYYSGTGGLINNCLTSPCAACPAGQYNPTCANASQGTCISIPTPPAGYYYATTNNGVTLSQVPVTQCTFPTYNVALRQPAPGPAPGTATRLRKAAQKGSIWRIAAGSRPGRARVAHSPVFLTATSGRPTAGRVLPGACTHRALLRGSTFRAAASPRPTPPARPAATRRRLLRVWGGLQVHMSYCILRFHLHKWPIPLWLRVHPWQPGLVRCLHQLRIKPYSGSPRRPRAARGWPRP